MNTQEIVDAAERKVGKYIYSRIGFLTRMEPKPETAEAAELKYLLAVSVGIDFQKEKAEAGEELAPFPAPAE